MAHGTEFLPSKWETGIELLVLNISLAWVYKGMGGMNRQMGCVCVCVCASIPLRKKETKKEKNIYTKTAYMKVYSSITHNSFIVDTI